MKKPKRTEAAAAKLKLSGERIRVLAESELGDAAGGGPPTVHSGPCAAE
jgi:hypothetical protein